MSDAQDVRPSEMRKIATRAKTRNAREPRVEAGGKGWTAGGMEFMSKRGIPPGEDDRPAGGILSPELVTGWGRGLE